MDTMTKLRVIVLGVLLLLSTSMALAGNLVSQTKVRKDVTQLVHAAHKLDKLWPWQHAIHEVSVVAADGRPAGPFLLTLLVNDPDDDKNVDWHVQQQVALTLCKIYGIKAGPGRVYMNRVFPKTNRRIKPFWKTIVSGR